MYEEYVVYTHLLKDATEEALNCQINEWLDEMRRDPKTCDFEVISISMSRDYNDHTKVYGLITYKIKRMIDNMTGDIIED